MAQEIADSNLIDTWSSSGLAVKPDISKIIEGWQLGEQPPHEYMNWLQNTFGSKLNHILKNGVAKWNDETEYLAGSSVQHSGNIWLCKTTNTNSEPTDVNTRWKRIITVEALTTVLSGYVATTGDQTIAGVKTFSSTIAGSINGNAATVTNGVYTTGDQTISGVKTFSSSPIVPTPTENTQVANKSYVDSEVASSGGVGINQTWQDVIASRSAGVTYTNNTGKPIFIAVYLVMDGGSYGQVLVNGVEIAKSGGGTVNDLPRNTLSLIVPNGSTYSVTVNGSIGKWHELR